MFRLDRFRMGSFECFDLSFKAVRVWFAGFWDQVFQALGPIWDLSCVGIAFSGVPDGSVCKGLGFRV